MLLSGGSTSTLLAPLTTIHGVYWWGGLRFSVFSAILCSAAFPWYELRSRTLWCCRSQPLSRRRTVEKREKIWTNFYIYIYFCIVIDNDVAGIFSNLLSDDIKVSIVWFEAEDKRPVRFEVFKEGHSTCFHHVSLAFWLSMLASELPGVISSSLLLLKFNKKS